MIDLQKALVAAALLAAVGAGIYEANQASTLRRQNQMLLQKQASLADQIWDLICEDGDDKSRSTQMPEALQPQVLPSEQLSELLRLRSQVGLLRDKLQEHAAKEAGARPTNGPETTRLTSTAFCARVPAGQTLISGGWISESGKRLFMISTPSSAPGDNSINIESSLVEVTEAVWNRLGFETLRASPSQEVQNMVGTPEVPNLLQGFKDDFTVVRVPRISTFNGRAAMVSVEVPDGAPGNGSANSPRFLTIGVTPRQLHTPDGVISYALVMNVHVLHPTADAAILPLPNTQP